MRPRIFIGSSKESLDIANAIQENLQHDSNPTVWTQGIFKLSSNPLDDLIKALDNFDFGIFVFKPDDITIIRQDKLNSVRDNVIFELGLFIGKLGKENVFFVLPEGITNFRLPTDLTGINAGSYYSDRGDDNFSAALGPFCNQVREKIKNFIYESLVDLANESEEAKRIAIEKRTGWEYLLSAELLETRMININRTYEELKRGLIFQKTKEYSELEFIAWISSYLSDIFKLIDILNLCFNEEFQKSFGEPGIPGNIFEIKTVVERITSICKELTLLEYELQGMEVPDVILEPLQLLKGNTKLFVDEINKYPVLIKSAIKKFNETGEGFHEINLKFTVPPNLEKANNMIKELIVKHRSS